MYFVFQPQETRNQLKWRHQPVWSPPENTVKNAHSQRRVTHRQDRIDQ